MQFKNYTGEEIAFLVKKVFKLYVTANYSLQKIKESFMKEGGISISKSGVVNILQILSIRGKLD